MMFRIWCPLRKKWFRKKDSLLTYPIGPDHLIIFFRTFQQINTTRLFYCCPPHWQSTPSWHPQKKSPCWAPSIFHTATEKSNRCVKHKVTNSVIKSKSFALSRPDIPVSRILQLTPFQQVQHVRNIIKQLSNFPNTLETPLKILPRCVTERGSLFALMMIPRKLI